MIEVQSLDVYLAQTVIRHLKKKRASSMVLQLALCCSIGSSAAAAVRMRTVGISY